MAESGEDIAHYKVVMLGEAGVGKTCIVNRYTKGSFTNSDATIGSNYCSKIEQAHPSGVAQPVKVKL